MSLRHAVFALLVGWPALSHAASGVVHHSDTLKPVAGVQLFLLRDDTGEAVPRAQLGPGQQGQRTPLSGAYQFDPPAGRYRIVVAPGEEALLFPSQTARPRGGSGAEPSGSLATSTAPVATVEVPARGGEYVLRFTSAGQHGELTNNHIPLDPVHSFLSLSVKLNRSRLSAGDLVALHLGVDNRTEHSFVGGEAATLRVALPASLKALQQTVEWHDESARAVVATVPVREGGVVELPGLALVAGHRYSAHVRGSVGVAATRGVYRLVASLSRAGRALVEDTVVRFEVEEDTLFERSEILGRVFCDEDGDQRLSERDRGASGAVVYLDSGAYAVADRSGKFHFSNVQGGVHLAKVDLDSLPPGALSLDGIRRDFHLTRGLPAKLDFAFDCSLQAAHPDEVPASQASDVVVEVQGLPLQVRVGEQSFRPFDFDVRGSLVDWEPSRDDVLLVQRDRDGNLPALYMHLLGGVPSRATRHLIRLYGSDGGTVIEREVNEPPAPVMRLPVLPDTMRDGRYAYDMTVWADGLMTRTARRWLRIETPPLVDSTLVVEVLRGDLFDKKDAPTPELIARVAKLKLPPEGPVTIEVHSADDGPQPNRMAMSLRRAVAAQRVLVAAGVVESRLQALGKGDAEPLVPNLGTKGRQENRRVVIKWPQPGPQSRATSMPIEDAWPASSPKLRVADRAIEWDGVFAHLVHDGPPAEVSVELRDGRAFVVEWRVASERTGSDRMPEPEADHPPASAPSSGASQPVQLPLSFVADEREVRGDLFRRDVLGRDLQEALDALRLTLGEGVKAEIEVHAGGGPGGDGRIELEATTQEAQQILDYLARHGAQMSAIKVSAKGRSQPLVPPLGRKAQDLNRRVVVRVLRADPEGTPVPVPNPVTAASSPTSLPVIAAPQHDVESRRELEAISFYGPENGARFKLPRYVARIAAPVGTTVALGERVETVGSDGELLLETGLNEGDNTLVFDVTTPAGVHGRVVRQHRLDPNRWFLLALGEMSGGEAGAQAMLPETTAESTIRVADNKAFLHGRGVLYFKGRFKGDWFFKDNRVTAWVDTAQLQSSTAIRQVIEPDKFYPVYGDAADEVQDVNTNYKAYVLIEADESTARVGNFLTELRGIELVRYDRSLFGGRMHFSRAFGAYDRTDLTGFVGTPLDASRRAHVSLRGTGGALFVLRDRDLVEGSEQVKVVIRDQISGAVVSEVKKTRNLDYTISYDTGRLVFLAPIPSVAPSQMGLRSVPISVSSGDPVFVEVDYEARTYAGTSPATQGAYVKETLFDKVTLGAGFVNEARQGERDYRLLGGSLEVKPLAGVVVAAEVARSESRDTTIALSTDGGLSYANLDRPTTTIAGGAIPVSGWAAKGTATLDVAKLLRREGELATVSLYGAHYDPNYYASTSTYEQGQTKFGAQARALISDRDAVMGRYDGSLTRLGEATSVSFDQRRIERHLGALGYEHKETNWSAGASYFHAVSADSDPTVSRRTLHTDTLTLRGDYWFTPKIGVFASQDFVVNVDRSLMPNDADRFASEVGARYRFTPGFEAVASEIIRYGGSNATQVGLRLPNGNDGRLYVNERFSRDLGGWAATTIVGGENAVARGSRAYGEYQFDSGVSGRHARAVFGLDNRWLLLDGLYVHLSYERSQNAGTPLPLPTGAGSVAAGLPSSSYGYAGFGSGVLSRDRAFFAPSAILGLTNPVGVASRDAASMGLELVRFAFLKATARFEVRYDNQDVRLSQGDRLTWFATAGASAQVQRDFTVVGRLEWADSRDMSAGRLLAQMVLGSVGLSYRPTRHDYFNGLLKYTRRSFLAPRDVDAQSERETSDVVSFVPMIELPWLRTQVVEKVAVRFSELELSGVGRARSTLLLWINRLNFHVFKWLDASAEYRVKHLSATGDSQGGFLAEVSVLPWEFVRLGAGYNFTHFSDDEFADPRIDNKGFFVRATGRY